MKMLWSHRRRECRGEGLPAALGFPVRSAQPLSGNAAELGGGPRPMFFEAEAAPAIAQPAAEAGETAVRVTVTASVLMAPC